MANKQEKDVKTGETEVKDTTAAVTVLNGKTDVAKAEEEKSVTGWFSKLSTPMKVGLGVVATAIVGGIGFGVKCLIDAFTGGDDDDSDASAPEETESPTDE